MAIDEPEGEVVGSKGADREEEEEEEEEEERDGAVLEDDSMKALSCVACASSSRLMAAFCFALRIDSLAAFLVASTPCTKLCKLPPCSTAMGRGDKACSSSSTAVR